MNRTVAALLAAAALSCTAAPAAFARPSDAKMLERMMAGESALQGKDLERAMRKAEAFPLGGAKNPVRVTMPEGERGYLARLRCADGKPPLYRRDGSTGEGPYGNIMDLYTVTCEGGAPAASEVYMDMYHGGFAEPRPVPGFTVAE